jgi:epoxyqueuosine reductase QueG
MKELLKEYFERMKVEYFSVVAYSDRRVTASRIIERESFTPRSVIIFLLPYYTGETVNISRYAASLDYHLAVKAVGEGLCECLKRKYPSANTHIYGDHSPIDERHAAMICGLGMLGENGLLINENTDHISLSAK